MTATLLRAKHWITGAVIRIIVFFKKWRNKWT